MTCLNHAPLAASLAALTVAADAAAAWKPESASGKRLGIIVIMTDQQTAAAMSCAGNPVGPDSGYGRAGRRRRALHARLLPFSAERPLPRLARHGPHALRGRGLRQRDPPQRRRYAGRHRHRLAEAGYSASTPGNGMSPRSTLPIRAQDSAASRRWTTRRWPTPATRR